MSTYDEHDHRAKCDDKLLKLFEDTYKLKDDEWNDDWYVTISFYSAVQHFEAMLAKVRPEITLSGYPVRIEHTTDLYYLYGIKYDTLGGAHRSRLRLIMENDIFPPNLSKAYYWLHSNSHSAKYNNYQTNKKKWIEAKRMLDMLKDACRLLIYNI